MSLASRPAGSSSPLPGPLGPRFWISAAIGWAVIGWGVYGIFANSLDTRPANLAKFVVGGALLHDLVVAPIVILAGVLMYIKRRD